jgi:hypothetical protein
MQPAFDTSGMASTRTTACSHAAQAAGADAVHGPSPWPRRPRPPLPLAPFAGPASNRSLGGLWPMPSDYEHGPAAAAQRHSHYLRQSALCAGQCARWHWGPQ